MGDIINSVNSIVEFFSTITSGVVYVTEQLFEAPSTLGKWIAALPSDWSLALTGFVAVSVALAVVRWVT